VGPAIRPDEVAVVLGVIVPLRRDRGAPRHRRAAAALGREERVGAEAAARPSAERRRRRRTI